MTHEEEATSRCPICISGMMKVKHASKSRADSKKSALLKSDSVKMETLALESSLSSSTKRPVGKPRPH